MDIDIDLWLKDPPNKALTTAISQGYIAKNMGGGMVAVSANSLSNFNTLEQGIISFLDKVKIDKYYFSESSGTLRVACYIDYNKQASATILLSRDLIAFLHDLTVSLEVSIYPCS